MDVLQKKTNDILEVWWAVKNNKSNMKISVPEKVYIDVKAVSRGIVLSKLHRGKPQAHTCTIKQIYC